MEDTTITESTSQETSSGEQSSQLEGAVVEAEGQAEVSESNDSGEVDISNNNEESEAQAETLEIDKDLAKWAEAKGVSIDSEKEVKLAQMARESERSMHQSRQEKSELQKTLAPEESYVTPPTEDTDVMSELQQVKLQLAVQNFYQLNPEARDLDTQMAEVVQERPHLANDLEALYAFTKSKQTGSQAESLKKEGGREALTQLANKQQATAVKGSAVNSAPTTSESITAQNVDSLIEKNGQAWYLKNMDQINKVLENN